MEQKHEALQTLDKGKNYSKVVDDYDFCNISVGNWKRKGNEIERWYSVRDVNGGDQKEANK